tara:strand:- start:104 stop:4645 length:4542 start_codon:yes stop_codon:yes gene_type:complete
MKKIYLTFSVLLLSLFLGAQSINSVIINNTPSCPGDFDGDVTVNINQTAPVSYVEIFLYRENPFFPGVFVLIGQSTGANNQFLFPGLDATNYRLDLRDSSNANSPAPTGLLLDQATFTINDPVNLSASFITSNISCNGFTDGAIDLTVNGGTPFNQGIPYSYSWIGPGAFTSSLEDITGLSNGLYTCVITDSKGCTISVDTNIIEPSILTSNGFISQSIVGNGNYNGEITAQASGGTPPYQYSINNLPFQSNPVFDSLNAGTYILTYTDTNGCQNQETITLTEPIGVSGYISVVSSVSCNGYCDASLKFNVVGGTAPFLFSLNNSPFGSSFLFNNLCGDSTYSITVRDSDSSVFVSSVYLTQPEALTFIASVQQINTYGVSCNWGCDGSIFIDSVIGGAGSPVSYSINGGSFTSAWAFNNLCPDTYSIAVRDGAGCMTYDTISITAPDSLKIISASSSNILCTGDSSGVIDIDSVVGGVMPYTYSLNAVSNNTSSLFDSLTAGNYVFSVEDANGCVVQDSLILTEPNTLQINYSVQNSSLPGSYTGSIAATVSGGTSGPPNYYCYYWSGPNGLAVSSCGMGYNWTLDSLSAGFYTLNIVDNAGCTAVADSILITEPAVVIGCTDSVALNYDPNANVDNGLCYYCAINYSLYSDNPSNQFTCNGWIAAPVPLSGATAPINWYWSNGVSGNNYLITGLCNDTFSVTIIDANQCGADTTILLSNYVGCTDSTMFNYNPQALFDDGSCEMIIFGCDDPSAFNYDSLANTDDGSCIPTIFGCMDTLALNYDSLANTDDGNCVLPVFGCTDSTATNYNPLANIDNGTCIGFYYGCTDPNAANWDPFANIDDSTCWYCVDGCMDSSAFNYNPLATCNDSSCIPYIYGCTDPLAFNYDPNANTDDGNCIISIYGCTDSTSFNYDPNANIDNGSCYNCGFSNASWYIDTTNIDSCQAFAALSISSINSGLLSYNWNTVLGTYSNIPTLPWAQNLCLGIYSVTVQDSVGCVFSDTITIGNVVLGCTDPAALNYNSSATLNDGSCCLPPAVDLTIGTWNFVFDWGCTGFDTTYYINYNSVGVWSNFSQSGLWELCGVNYTHTYFVDQTIYTGVYNNGIITGTMSNPNTTTTGCFSIFLDSSTVTLGCMDSLAINYNTSAQIDDGSCILPVLGCTDSLACNYDINANQDNGLCLFISGCTDPIAINYDSSACIEDGSCTYSTSCNSPTPTNIHVTDIIHTKARVKWDNMSSSVCTPNQYRVQYREVGTNVWSNKNVLNNNNCGAFNQTGRLLTNLTPSTTYEYRVKTWYCFTAGSSSWSSINTFTTLDECPNVGSFNVTTPLTTRAVFTWDDSNGPYSFVRIKLRVDSISNPTNADWGNAGGFGVTYGTWTRNKNGLIPGETYRGQSRTWCDSLGGAYKSNGWTPLIFWTQPTSVRMGEEYTVSNLEVYPNPSRDIFNISFTSEEIQNVSVRVLNLLGELIVKEDLQQFVGEYVKVLNLNNYEKGVYLLEIKTNHGVINKKLILQ